MHSCDWGCVALAYIHSASTIVTLFIGPADTIAENNWMIHMTEASTPNNLWAPTASDLTNPCHVK